MKRTIFWSAALWCLFLGIAIDDMLTVYPAWLAWLLVALDTLPAIGALTVVLYWQELVDAIRDEPAPQETPLQIEARVGRWKRQMHSIETDRRR